MEKQLILKIEFHGQIFLSLESRQDGESWQSLEISKEIQVMLLEQSICQPSKMYRRYKVI